MDECQASKTKEGETNGPTFSVPDWPDLLPAHAAETAHTAFALGFVAVVLAKPIGTATVARL